MAAAEELPDELVFVDLETTGGNPAYDRITEVGLYRLNRGELVDEWSSLVNPECPIPPYIEAFTGISSEMVADAPRFADLARLLHGKLAGAVFVAHNARFDYAFLRSEFLKAGMTFSAKVLCTVKLSRRLFPEFVRHNLDAVMERNGLTCSARHRALGDARVLHDFWFKLRRDVPQPQLAAAVQKVLGAHQMPAHLRDLPDELPEGPGVYRFFGADDALLYIGRGASLRARVCRHFSAAEPADRLQSEVRRVDWLETAGELGAMLREAQWIKQQQPAYDRHAQRHAQSHTLRVRTAAGCPVETVAVTDLELEDLAQCFGLFHSTKDARKALGNIARARTLCLKVLGLEEAEGSCLAYQVGKCKGACVGKEPPVLHNTRLQLALASLKLKAWPFPGRVALRERAWRGTELHVVDRWAYLGTARTDDELAALTQPANLKFDADVYRILVRHLAKHPRLDWLDLRGGTVCT